ncbi:hypothetical protein [Streptomyces melanogenes]
MAMNCRTVDLDLGHELADAALDSVAFALEVALKIGTPHAAA